MKSFHELLDELENALHLKGLKAEFAHLLDGLRSHGSPAAQEPAGGAQPVAEASAKPESPAPAVVAVSQPPAAAPIDYAAYKDMTVYDIRTHVFPNGLPVGWDWAAWCEVSKQPNPDTHSVSGDDLTKQPTGPAEVWGDTLDWNENGGVRHQEAKANVPVVFHFTNPEAAAKGVRLASPFGPRTGEAAKFLYASIDGGPEQKLSVNNVAADLPPFTAAPGAHTVSIRVDGDIPDLRLQMVHD